MIPERIGKYAIEGELGRGGMAVVYAARDPVIGRPVALKVIRRSELDPAEAGAILERFRREAQAAGALQHPNIVAIYEYGEDEESSWIAMERVDGRPLADHLRSGYRPDPSKLPEVLEQLLEALDYSHARGVVHRDVKPSNVLISGMGAAKISDFGIARIERSHLTQVGEVLGTPYYMAPEQFDGKPASDRTDIYAAGVMVYEVLCGRRPFDGQGGSLLRQIMQDAPPLPSTLNPQLPKALDAVLARALAKRPADRYPGARDFLEALRAAYAAPAPAVVPVARLAGNLGALRRGLGAASAQATAAAPSPGAAPAPVPATRRPAVLCVDDEARVLNALSLLLGLRFEVETASSGAEALDKLRARRFHALVSDQRMPGMTGVELLREAKKAAPGTVRLLLTGYSDLAAIVGSVNESEVFRFISKPWNNEDLLATLDEAVGIAIAIEAAAARGRPAAKSDAAVLVLGEPALARAARELGQGALRVLQAADLDEALRLLSAEDVGVLVFDLDTQGAAAGEDPAALLRIVKKESPQTQLLVASQATDSELIISLINEARIYRFLKKPVNLTLLKESLGQALDRHARMRASPELRREESARARGETAAASAILSRLRALGGRFAAALRRS